jgi:hypothetical protein
LVHAGRIVGYRDSDKKMTSKRRWPVTGSPLGANLPKLLNRIPIDGWFRPSAVPSHAIFDPAPSPVRVNLDPSTYIATIGVVVPELDKAAGADFVRG